MPGPAAPLLPRLAPVISALSFVHVEPGRLNQVGEAISRIDGVRAVYSVTGAIDFVVVIEVVDHDGVARVVTDGISTVPGVTNTETHIAFRTYRPDDLEAGFSIGS